MVFQSRAAKMSTNNKLLDECFFEFLNTTKYKRVYSGRNYLWSRIEQTLA